MKKKILLIFFFNLFCFMPFPILAAPYGAGFYDTSEYMIGEVAVGIIFPESDGSIDTNSENWTQGMKNMVISEIQTGLNWWATQDTRANLSFVYVSTTVTTGYEPINRPTTDQSLWIAEIMSKMRYTDTYYPNKVRRYCNYLRDTYNTDWAFVIFVANSLNDPDGSFTDKTSGGWNYFAYAYLGGPFEVMTYDNDGYGISAMDRVCAHETGHIFYAADEYTGNGWADATTRIGYLNVLNGNYEDGGVIDVSCIMRGGTTNSVCSYTKYQIGWRDSDGDNIFDILDLPPTTTLNTYTPDPTSDNTPTYNGKTGVSAYPNSNPNHPWLASTSNDISINTIGDVQYKVDSSLWLSATATDGSFDQYFESFTFTSSVISDGQHVFQVRGKDSVNNLSLISISDILTIDSSALAKISTINDGATGDIAYTSLASQLSANWTAPSDIERGIAKYWYAIGTVAGGTDIVDWSENGTSTSVTRTGLSLVNGIKYYFTVKTENLSGVQSMSTNSNGQIVMNNLAGITVYPNPYKPNSGMGYPGIVFTRLTAEAKVEIYTLNGEKVREMHKDNITENLIWDVRNDGGENLASGVYFYIVTSNAGEKKIGKIAVVK